MACSSEHRFNEVNEHTRDKEELNAEITKELDAELDRVLEVMGGGEMVPVGLKCKEAVVL